MRSPTRRRLIAAATFAMLLASSLSAELPSGGNYVLLASTIDNGGGMATGGSFVLHGTAGQPEAGKTAAKGGKYILAGGFWAEIVDTIDLIFQDRFESPPSK